MSFTINERVIAGFNALVGGVLDTDPVVQWYESINPFEFISAKDKVWTQSDTLRANPAANLAAAQANAAGALSGIIDDLSLAASAIRLTPFPSVNNGWIALATYNDFSSARLDNWVQPAFVPQTNGLPSTGYAVRVYEGDPAGAGVEVLTTDGTTGTGQNKSVAWVFNYAGGLLLISDDFATITDPYITGFRYIGTVAGAGEDAAAIHDNVDDEYVGASGGEETAPAVGDRFLLESLANSLEKRWVQLSNLVVSKLRSATTVIDVGSAAAPTVGQVLTATSGTAATWQDAGGGSTVDFDLTVYTDTSPPTPAANKIHLLDPSNAAFAVTIPAASGFTNGDVLGFKYAIASAQQVTLNRSGSDLIEGQTSYVMNQPLGALTFKTDGVASWWIV